MCNLTFLGVLYEILLNVCMWDFEHFSATPPSVAEMQAFRDCLEVCELADLGFSGVPIHMII